MSPSKPKYIRQASTLKEDLKSKLPFRAIGDLRASLLVGGDSKHSQFDELAQDPDCIVATPGRLMHHLEDVDDMSLRIVEYVVFYEADCLFSMGLLISCTKSFHIWIKTESGAEVTANKTGTYKSWEEQ